MVKELYSCGCFTFESAKDLADFKINYPNEWDSVKHCTLRKSALSIETYQDFVDYLDSLDKMPDICLTYKFDNVRWYGFNTTVWCNGLEIRGIFGYHESSTIEDHLVFEIVGLSKWAGMEIRQKLCR